MLFCVCLVVLIVFFTSRNYEKTDNAYVGANSISVAAEVSGKIIHTYVENNQFVKAGQLLFEIDPTTFIIEVQKTQAGLEQQSKEIRKFESEINENRALVEERAAELETARNNVVRVEKLFEKHVVAKEMYDNAHSNVKGKEAALAAAKEKLQQAEISFGKIGDNNEEIRIAIANRDQAKNNLSKTQVYAPISGQISNYALYRGHYVQEGVSLFAIISDKEFWVEANFKETQLENIRPGQDVSIKIDMYGNKEFKGIVQSVSGASGAVFSLLPPQNATGNWVKITQRIPVRIIIETIDENFPLRIGSSANVKVVIK